MKYSLHLDDLDMDTLWVTYRRKEKAKIFLKMNPTAFGCHEITIIDEANRILYQNKDERASIPFKGEYLVKDSNFKLKTIEVLVTKQMGDVYRWMNMRSQPKEYEYDAIILITEHRDYPKLKEVVGLDFLKEEE